MKIVIKADFWFDGIDEVTKKEFIEYVEAMLESGAESTSSDIENIVVEIVE